MDENVNIEASTTSMNTKQHGDEVNDESNKNNTNSYVNINEKDVDENNNINHNSNNNNGITISNESKKSLQFGYNVCL